MKNIVKVLLFCFLLGFLASLLMARTAVEKALYTEEPVIEYSLAEVSQPYKLTYVKETAPEATPEPTPTPTPTAKPTTGCPISDEDIVMLAQTMYGESQVLNWIGEYKGQSPQARQAAVAWCALNRLDAGFENTLGEVVSAPFQFAYDPSNPVTEEMLLLANDVVCRWWAEKIGYTNVGRTLPEGYYWFFGDGTENYFTNEYHGTDYWDWSLPDPYKEAGTL